MSKLLGTNEALPSEFLKESTPHYVSEESYITSPEAFNFCEDTCLFNDSFSENENSVSDVEKWNFVRVFFFYFSLKLFQTRITLLSFIIIQIDSWLKNHFKDKRIPLFERNPAVASALYEMALFNKQQDAMIEIIIKRQNIQVMEYRAEGYTLLSNGLLLFMTIDVVYNFFFTK